MHAIEYRKLIFNDQDNSKNNSTNKLKEGNEIDDKVKYIDPKWIKTTDFTKRLAKDETKEKLKEKTVPMFCTGGIRCERASFKDDCLGGIVCCSNKLQDTGNDNFIPTQERHIA